MQARKQSIRPADGILALFVIAAMYVTTYCVVKFIPLDAHYPMRAIFASLPVYSIIIALLLLRRQTSATIGLNKNPLFYVAIAVVTLTVGIKALSQRSVELFARWVFYLFAVGGAEEFVFRGYAHDRLTALCRNRVVAFVVAGALFGAGHHISNMVWDGAVLSGIFWTLGGGIVGHLFFYAVWKRTGNILSAVLLHTCLDFSSEWIGGIILCAIFLLPMLILGEKRMPFHSKFSA